MDRRRHSGVVQANHIEICFETFGDPSDPALLFVMGMGVQLIDWDPEFCMQFVEHGFCVVRYDNRDVGLSTKFENPEATEPASAPYTLFDMADDGIGLLDALGVEQAHIVGASMGGMIAQAMAIQHPHRVKSLCSIMSTTGARDLGRPNPEVFNAIIGPSPETRAEAIEATVFAGRLVAGHGYPYDEAAMRRRAAAAFDRAHYPSGKARQVAAIASSGDRTEALRRLQVPTLVIHGADDPLVPLRAGEATAAAIPGAKLVVIPGMGHEFPDGARPRIVAEIVDHVRRASL